MTELTTAALSPAEIKARYPVGTECSVNSPKWPGIWIVSRWLTVNVSLTPKGGGRGLRCSPTMLTPPTDNPSAALDAMLARRTLHPGQLVIWADPAHGGLFVVLADKLDRVNIAKFGGDEKPGRYWRANPAGLKVVDAGTIAAMAYVVTGTG